MIQFEKELTFELLDKAQSKVDTQRDSLARLAPNGFLRVEKRILDAMINNAQLATTARALLDPESSSWRRHL